MNVTLASWRQTWQALGAAQADEALFKDLVARYSESHRHYHTLQHLRECFEQFTQARGDAQRPAEIELALWFHDAVYDVHRDDNEERSAALAHASVLAAGLARDAADRVHVLVMATRHDAPPGEPDAQLLVDADLSILGAEPARFDESDLQIRAEYAHVPDAQFREGRKRVLGSFLARPRLYCTDRFFAKYEQQARDNLRRSLARLEAGPAA
jgi:predicted metal-dependent HD superfamily phosphohydrolase